MFGNTNKRKKKKQKRKKEENKTKTKQKNTEKEKSKKNFLKGRNTLLLSFLTKVRKQWKYLVE
jgi:hypothetical protein